MRRQLVPGPLRFAGADVGDARSLLDEVLPVAYAVLGLDDRTASKITGLLRADLDFLRPALDGEPQRVASIAELTQRAHMSRSSLYAELPSLALSATRCGVAAIELLALRGDFGDSFAWRLCQLDSPVGREAKGPGISDSRQRLFGISLIGADVDVPAILTTPPTNQLDQPQLLAEVGLMVSQVLGIANEIRRYAIDERLLIAGFDLSKEEVTDRDLTSTLLAPEIQLGPASGGWDQTISLGDTSLADDALMQGFASAIVETDEPLWSANALDSSGWHQVRPDTLRRLMGGASVDLDIEIRPSLVAYWVHAGPGGGALHRRQIAMGDEDSRSTRLASGGLSYSVVGLDLQSSAHLATAIAYVELLASGRGDLFTRAFGEQFTPSLVKASTHELRSLYRALRVMSHAALAAIVRKRQAELIAQKLSAGRELPGHQLMLLPASSRWHTAETDFGPIRVRNLGVRRVWIEHHGDSIVARYSGEDQPTKVIALLDAADGHWKPSGRQRDLQVEVDSVEVAGTRVQRAALRGPHALSPSERRVVALAVEGLSNRQIAEALFVTRKAVEWHLGNAYRKLDVRSRSELSTALETPEEPAAGR
jgi:DNA-binding CsgD family transcriptional regulator